MSATFIALLGRSRPSIQSVRLRKRRENNSVSFHLFVPLRVIGRLCSSRKRSSMVDCRSGHLRSIVDRGSGARETRNPHSSVLRVHLSINERSGSLAFLCRVTLIVFLVINFSLVETGFVMFLVSIRSKLFMRRCT